MFQAGIESSYIDTRKLLPMLLKSHPSDLELLFSRQVTFSDCLASLYENRDEIVHFLKRRMITSVIGNIKSNMSHLQKLEFSIVPGDKIKNTRKMLYTDIRLIFTMNKYLNGETFADALWIEGDQKDYLMELKTCKTPINPVSLNFMLSSLQHCVDLLSFNASNMKNDFSYVEKLFSGVKEAIKKEIANQ